MGPSKASSRAPRYTVHAEAAGIFAFLKTTFFQMPKSVQVIGWFVFLFLFVFLVLYQALGVAYFSGEVRELTTNSTGEQVVLPVTDLTVSHERTVVTNKEGRFVIPVIGFVLPFFPVEFSFSRGGGNAEPVTLRYIPLASTFNPNATKIYYVAGSHERSGWAVQHYFLDEVAAIKSLGAGLPTRQSSAAARWLGSFTVEAAPPASSRGMPRIRLQSLASANLQSTVSDVYVGLTLDGKQVGSRAVPARDSPASSRLTLLPGVATRLDGAEIPIPPNSRSLDIALYNKRVVFSDVALGTIHVALPPISADTVGRSLVEKQNGLQLNYEILPPLEFMSTGIRAGKGKYIISQIWLESPPEFMGAIANVHYDLGPNFSPRYVEMPDVTSWDNFAHAISFYTPQTVNATVNLAGGSIMNLTEICGVTSGPSRSPLDEAFRARNYYVDNQNELALKLTDQALTANPRLQWLIVQRAEILGNLKRYDEAVAVFDQVLNLGNPYPPVVLNSYAWFVADGMANPGRRMLEEALRRSQQSLLPRADANYMDTEGWIYYKLADYGNAEKVLVAARDLQAAASNNQSAWQEIQYHLGKVLLKLDRPADARKCFDEVVAFSSRRPTVSKAEYVAEARRILGAK
jgi:Tfp pilus assembly protein PilF